MEIKTQISSCSDETMFEKIFNIAAISRLNITFVYVFILEENKVGKMYRGRSALNIYLCARGSRKMAFQRNFWCKKRRLFIVDAD